MQKTNVSNRWYVVLGATLIQLCLGAIYAWSVFTPILAAEGWSKLQTQVTFTVSLVSFAAVMVWAGRKLTAYGPRKLTFLSGFVLGGGYILAGLIGGTDFWALTLLIGLVGGAGIGLGYVVPIAVCIRWFPDKKGLITGLAVAGFGFGAMGWVKFADSWGQLLPTIGISNTFALYGAVFIVLICLGGIWMVFPPEGWRPANWTAAETAKASGEETNFSSAEMLATPQFYLIFFTFVATASAGLMAIGLMKLYPMEALQAAGYSREAASGIAGTAMGVFYALANGLGRILWGAISDRLGRKRSILIMSATQGLFAIAFTMMAGNEYLLYLGATLIGFNYGGIFSLFPAMTADTFGAKNVGQNYPYVFLAYGTGAIAGPVLGGLLGDMGNFPLAFTICGIACLVSAGCIAVVQPPAKRLAMAA